LVNNEYKYRISLEDGLLLASLLQAVSSWAMQKHLSPGKVQTSTVGSITSVDVILL